MTIVSYISRLSGHPAAEKFPRAVSILGSTGSIGVNALKVVDEHPELFTVAALAGARNVKLLAEQAAHYRPQYLGVLTEEGVAELADRLVALAPDGYMPEIVYGPDGYTEIAALDEPDIVLAAQVGAAGLAPALVATHAGKIIALANKEALVMAGGLFRKACAASGAVILPVDSEHNALFQGLVGHAEDRIRKLILTASGGPFRGRTPAQLANVTPEDALKHPNWSMGAKISIDSATLMNKGLEVIEAHHLYGLDASRLDVVVHPQSIVHSLVEYCDGSMLAHLGPPDMRIPIAYCLGWPSRMQLSLPSLNLAEAGKLTFEEPDMHTFPCLAWAMACLEEEDNGPPVVLNAANEAAVQLFLDRKISFPDIPRLVGLALDSYTGPSPKGYDDIMALDAMIRETTEEQAKAMK